MKIQNYFVPSNLQITTEDMEMIFKMKCRVTNLKTNLKGMYGNYNCDLCEEEYEDQEKIQINFGHKRKKIITQ